MSRCGRCTRPMRDGDAGCGVERDNQLGKGGFTAEARSTERVFILNSPSVSSVPLWCVSGDFRNDLFVTRRKTMRRRLSILTLGWLLVLTGMANAGAIWQEEWERVLHAAKKEGKVAIIGPIGADRRDALA